MQHIKVPRLFNGTIKSIRINTSQRIFLPSAKVYKNTKIVGVEIYSLSNRRFKIFVTVKFFTIFKAF